MKNYHYNFFQLILILSIFSKVYSKDLEKDYNRLAKRAVPKDSFPVLNNPKMKSAKGRQVMSKNIWVIGVAIGKEAKAYPISVMGRHELINDTCGGQPIAVSW